MAGISALSLLAGVLTVSVAEAPAGAVTTQTVSLAMTGATFAVKHNAPTTLSPIATPAFTGVETLAEGTLSTGHLKFPTQTQHTDGTTSTIYVLQAPGTLATGGVATSGQVSIAATIVYKLTVPAYNQTCVSSTPVHVVLSSTTPYTKAVKTVTVANSAIDIPNFSATNCSLAVGMLNGTFPGTGGELGLTLHGTLVVPPPAAPTTTALSATPASSQVAGASVELKATVKKTTGAPASAGSVTFRDGTTVIATESVSAGVATFTTTSLPVGTDKLTAAYGGGHGYKASTSAALTYTVKPDPSVSVENLPASITEPSSTQHAFTIKITNPASGVTWTHLYVKLTLSGLHNLSKTFVTLQYEDGSANWCTLLGWHGTTTVTGFVAGTYSTCTPTSPASFALASGSATTLHFRIGYLSPTGVHFYGTQKITATLYGGSCSSDTTCTPVAPLSGAAAPTASPIMKVLPPSPLATKVTDIATRHATGPVRQTFNVGLKSEVGPVPGSKTFGYPPPTGTVTYTVAGHQVVSTLSSPGTHFSQTSLTLFNTATLPVGHYAVTRTYSGDDVYAPSTLSESITVTPAPVGTPFICKIIYTTGATSITVPAYATAHGTAPEVVMATSASTDKATNVTTTLTIDPVFLTTDYNTTQSAASIGFAPTGSTGAKAGPITFSGTTKIATEIVGTWSGMSTTAPISAGAVPGSSITVGVDSVAFTAFFTTSWSCTPTTAKSPAPVASTEIAGTTLSASPTGSATVGTPVTLTAHVYPQPATGAAPSQVQFFDGTKSLGTTLVSTSGASRGTASLTVSTLALGAHSLTATWTGTSTNSIPFNASKALSYTVNPTPVTAPVVTTEPQSVGVKAGQTATFTAAASGTSPSVQWQVSTDGGKTWADVSGATSGTYSLTATKGDDGNQYRAVFTNSAGTATSNAATLFVTATGYWLTASNGAVYAYGNLPFYGSAGNLTLNKPIVGSAATPTGGGYWLVASDGGIFSYGSAQFYGSMGGKALNAPIVGMAPTPTGKGYWEVASDGGIFAFGAAQFYGSMGGKPLNQPVVGMAATPTGKGYWEVASDGGIFAFGAAQFHGSTGSMTLNKPITAMSTTPTGNGYWLVASDGGIFAFGTANFYGAAVGGAGAGVATSPVVGMAATTDGGGYLEVEADGRVVQFGDAALAGTALTQTLSGAAIVGITS